MVPELIAAEARRRGLDRDEARLELMSGFPMLLTGEIDKVLDTVYGDQSGQRVEDDVRRDETA